jgi:phytanoyl-CoA hydroxylase
MRMVARSAAVLDHPRRDVYDLEPGHSRRDTARAPHQESGSVVDRGLCRRCPGTRASLACLQQLWGGRGVRYDISKLNMKSAGFGSPVEWHQDWAFYPHTNDDLAAVGVMLDDIDLDNGPMEVVPGSHRGPIFDHHTDGHFCGAIDAGHAGLQLERRRPCLGPAGSITIHHARARAWLGAPNNSGRTAALPAAADAAAPTPGR